MPSVSVAPSPSGPASALPSPAPPEAVVAGFVAVAGGPDFSGHTSVVATMDIGAMTFILETSSDFAPTEMATVTTIEVDGQAVSTEVIVADGKAYVRPPGSGWRILPTPPIDPGQDVFTRLDDPSDVTYLKTQMVGGRILHRVRLNDALPIDPSTISSARILNVQVGKASFELLVDDAGIPVLGYYDFEGTATIENVEQAIVIDADYRFSKIGEPINIDPPI